MTEDKSSRFKLTGVEALAALKQGALAKRMNWTEDDGFVRAVKDWTGEYHIVYTDFECDPLDNVISFEDKCLPRMDASVNAGEFLHDDWGILWGWGDVPVKQHEELLDVTECL